MSDNLLSLISKLAYLIVNEEFNKKNVDPQKKNDKRFEKCYERVRSKGCDALLGRSIVPPPSDPCITYYGGNWSPATLITDYGRELREHGAEKYNEILERSVDCLLKNDYDCANEMLKFLLLLKKPLTDSTLSLMNDSHSDTEFFSTMNSFTSLNDDIVFLSNEGNSRSMCLKALKYEENWMRQFDSKFQFLGEYSKKNLLKPDPDSLESLFTAQPTLIPSSSHSNSYVFAEFASGKNYCSEKNIFHRKSCENVNETSLLDSFVETPINHQLPDLSYILKPWSRSGVRSNEIQGQYSSLTSESGSKTALDKSSMYESALVKSKPDVGSLSLIELKRNSNYSHSFSILYERVQNSHDLESDDSFLLIQEKNKVKDMSTSSSPVTSKQIILGLWEQEQLLIKEFKPELATSFPTLRMISMSDYVEDVKYLLTGINSSTFQFDVESNCFIMKYGTCLEDVTPESLFYFSEEFIRAGNCYGKLSSYAVEIGKNNFDTCTTISQAFWKSVFDYLELHYTVVLEIPRTINLISLKMCVREIGEMIMTVAEICKVLKPEESLPEGGQLLTYLISTAEKINKQSVRNLIFGILQNCCTVYFMCILQTWMFKGHLDNQNNELFIDWKRQKMKIKSRTYYNSFYVDHERTPAFLRGFEENIFNCGKSIHFLKLFNPEDKFIQILEKGEYPKMRPCLTEEGLGKLENDFKAYLSKVIDTCGGSVSVKTLREEEKEKERSYQEYVKECKRLQEKEREYIRDVTLEFAKAEKDFKNKLLNLAWSRIEAEKERKRLEAETEKKKFNEEMKAVAVIEKKITDRAKSSLKKYHDGLLSVIGKQISLAEMRKTNYLKILESPLSKTETESEQTENEVFDVINDNKAAIILTEKVDDEGNVTAVLDVNLNENLNTELTNKEKTVEYDENLNPSLEENVLRIIYGDITGDPEETVEEPTESVNKDGLYKSHSHRTLAAEEAEKNKCKVMKSEVGLGVRMDFENKTESVSSENRFMSELERNKRKVLESEYQILKSDSHWGIKGVKSQTQIAKDKSPVSVSEAAVSVPAITEKMSEGRDDEEEVKCRYVKLRRKLECTDLGRPPEEMNKEEIDSLTSFISNKDDASEENVGGKTEVEGEEPCMTVMKEEYKIALARDAKVFFHKLSPSEVFNNVEEEDSTTPCTDFTQLQRFLQKSALIPLRVQEKLANDALLSHLLKGENLLSHLQSLRSYFFLNDGEFGRSFTHNAFRSLAKCSEPKQFFERNNLSNIVNEALNYTIHNAEPNSQNLSFQIIKMPPFLNHSFHDVLSPFELSYKVDWPLNIILTEKVLSKYKMVFKFLLKLKRINWTMNENFLFLNSYVKNKNFNSKVLIRSPHYHKIQIFRHAITEVMITLDDYIFSSGIQFPWIYFLKDLETAENIDDLYKKHVKYIKDVLTRCFISKNSEDLLDCIHNLIETALKFHYTTKSSIFEEVNGIYVHPKFGVLKATFNEFCLIIQTFLGLLKEKIGTNQVLRLHHVLVEKFDLKLT